MPSPAPWSRAALAGVACSMRTFAGPALLAARARISGPPRTAVFVAAAGELVLDKASFAAPRTDPPALAGRIVLGGFTGHRIAGPVGAGAAALVAAVGTYATYHARRLLVGRTGLPDWVVAVGEDSLAYTAAALATSA